MLICRKLNSGVLRDSRGLGQPTSHLDLKTRTRLLACLRQMPSTRSRAIQAWRRSTGMRYHPKWFPKPEFVLQVGSMCHKWTRESFPRAFSATRTEADALDRRL